MKDIIFGKFPIETERLYLDQIKVEELIYIRSKLMVGEEYKMTCRPIKNKSHFELNDFYTKMLNSGAIVFSIKCKVDNRLIGKVSFFDYNERNNSIEMGYYLISDFRGYGYIREAILDTIQWLPCYARG